MGHKGFRQFQIVPIGLEPGVDLWWFEPSAALGHPQRGMVDTAEAWPDVLDVVSHRVHCPAEHRQHGAAARWLAALGLAIADVQRPVPVELRRGRVAAPIRQIELGRFGPAKSFSGGS